MTMTSRPLDPDFYRYYERGREAARLERHSVEQARTLELLARYLPLPPAAILDVGGGAGAYAFPLAAQGYTVHLVDLVPLHIEQARQAAAAQPDHPLASIRLGDARALDQPAASVDGVLLLGPLYHLTGRIDRLQALGEAYRVLRPGGVLLTVGISRFASLMDGLHLAFLDDPAFQPIVARDLHDGQHRNPTATLGYFTTTFFHHPDELRQEVSEAGFSVEALLAIEGPARMVPDLAAWWSDPARRERLLAAIRAVEAEPSLLGMSTHLMVIGRRSVRHDHV